MQQVEAGTVSEPQDGQPEASEATIRDVHRKLVYNKALRHDEDLSSEIGIVPELQRQQDTALKLLLAKRRLEMRERLAAQPMGQGLAHLLKLQQAAADS
jgi:hypothetical protein